MTEYLRTGRWPRRKKARYGDRPIPKTVKHGTSTCYTIYGCSCKDCKTWAREYPKQRKEQRERNLAVTAARRAK